VCGSVHSPQQTPPRPLLRRQTEGSGLSVAENADPQGLLENRGTRESVSPEDREARRQRGTLSRTPMTPPGLSVISHSKRWVGWQADLSSVLLGGRSHL